MFTIYSVFFLLLFNIQPGFTEPLTDSQPLSEKNTDILNTLTYYDLVQISNNEDFEGELKEKVDFVLQNAAYDNTISTNFNIKKNDDLIGKYLRMASWNIERGMEIDDILEFFHNPNKKIEELKNYNPTKVHSVKKQIDILRKADVLFLTEVDAGMPRTKYRTIPEMFGKSIGYNYAYAVEFLEIDPAHLGIEDCKWSEERLLFGDHPPEIIKSKYKGLHGTAILSRFPLKNIRVVRLPKVYDWYNGEKRRVSKLEAIKRMASSKIFSEGIIREIRYGSRLALIADIDVPGLDTPITLVATHLENRTIPGNRVRQIKVILNEIYNIKNPVIIAGDFNTAIADASPTSFKKVLKGKHRNFVLKHCFVYNIPHRYIIAPIMSLPNTFRKHDDPTIKNIPVFLSNPESGLFKTLKKFKFADGYHFDYRSTPGKFVGKKGTLANSNERGFKGFVPTFTFSRPLYFGKFKLDWFFAKAYNSKATSKHSPFKLAPHYGQTLFDLNFAYKDEISDHAPITIDLPITEPRVMTKQEIKIYEKQEKIELKEEKKQSKKQIKLFKKQNKNLKKEVKEKYIEEKQQEKDIKKEEPQINEIYDNNTERLDNNKRNN